MNRFEEMARRAFGIFLVLAFIGGLQAAEGVMGVFQENCISCHGKDGKVKREVNLLEIGS